MLDASILSGGSREEEKPTDHAYASPQQPSEVMTIDEVIRLHNANARMRKPAEHTNADFDEYVEAPRNMRRSY